MQYQRHPNTNCISCHTPIYRRPNQLEKNDGRAFCSLTCQGKFNRKSRHCLSCNKQIISRYGKKTCDRACSNKLRTGIKYHQNRPRDKVVYAAGLKIRLVIKRGENCERCNFAKTELLIVHHKDRNRNHNDLANLELICPNCHAEEHYLEKNWLKRYNISEFKYKLLT
jgi:hypothetical protein